MATDCKVLYTHLQRIELPVWVGKDTNPEQNTRVLIKFSSACKGTLTFIRGILQLDDNKHPLLLLQAKYIKQRLIVVLDRYEQWQQRQEHDVAGHSDLADANEMLAKEVAAILCVTTKECRDSSDETVLSAATANWLNGSVFKPAFAAIAVKYSDEPELPGKETQPLVKAWIDRCQGFLPSMIVYSVNGQIIGETCGRWRQLWWLEGWDKAIRDAAFAKEARTKYEQAREVLAKEVLGQVTQKPQYKRKRKAKDSNRERTGRELIVEGRNALEKAAPGTNEFLARSMSGVQWQAMTPAGLQWRDPCSTCQVFFGN
jgi:hypothetical protein